MNYITFSNCYYFLLSLHLDKTVQYLGSVVIFTVPKSSCKPRVVLWGFFPFLKCDMSGGTYRVAQKREDAVSKEVTRKLSEADNRKMSRKEKDER